MQIDNINFIIDFIMDNDTEAKCYIKQPIYNELTGIMKVLGGIFSLTRKENLHPQTILVDCLEYAEEIISELPEQLQETYKKRIDAFLSRSLLSCSIVYRDDEDMLIELQPQYLTENEKLEIKKHLLFLSALYRYSPKKILLKDLKGLFTLQNATEWKNSLQNAIDNSTKKEEKDIAR